jgi:hypothetical protein
VTTRIQILELLRSAAYPRDVESLNQFPSVVEDQIVGGYAPPEPFLSPSDRVACIGSCFAQEMAKALEALGRPTAPIFLNEEWNTAYAVRQFLEHALDGAPLPETFIPKGVRADQLKESVQGLKGSDAFILTFGLSLAWFRKSDGQMVLDVYGGSSGVGVINALKSHKMRQTTVAENVQQIMGALECIRKHKPSAPIVLTLSPIPLKFSFADYPIVPSNNISKATLRLAIHEVDQMQLEGVHYWPSYDIVEYAAKYHGPVFGLNGEDLRHVNSALIKQIMDLFLSHCAKH